MVWVETSQGGEAQNVANILRLLDGQIAGSGPGIAISGTGLTLGSGEAHLGAVGGTTVKATGTITRPNDTTTYTAGDVIADTSGAQLVIANCARVAGGSGLIQSCRVYDSANQALLPQIEVWLSPVSYTMDADNAPFTPDDTEILSFKSPIAVNTANIGNETAGTGGNVILSAENLAKPFVCVTGKSLYVVLKVKNAYIPLANEVFTVSLMLLQD